MAYVGFNKLASQLAQKGVRDPKALASVIGRRKFGKRRYQKAAAQGKKMKGMKPR